MKTANFDNLTNDEFVEKMKDNPQNWGYYRSRIKGGSISALRHEHVLTTKTFNYNNKKKVFTDFWNNILNLKRPIEVVIEYSLKDF